MPSTALAFFLKRYGISSIKVSFLNFIPDMPSTAISFFKYDQAKEILRVVFKSGMVYDYKKVPIDVYGQMRKAFSKGKFLNEEVKGKFLFEKIGSK